MEEGRVKDRALLPKCILVVAPRLSAKDLGDTPGVLKTGRFRPCPTHAIKATKALPRVDKLATARTAALTGLAAHKPLIPISQQVA